MSDRAADATGADKKELWLLFMVWKICMRLRMKFRALSQSTTAVLTAKAREQRDPRGMCHGELFGTDLSKDRKQPNVEAEHWRDDRGGKAVGVAV